MGSCVLFKCHRKDEATFAHLKKLQDESPYDVFAVFDSSFKDPMSAAFNYSIADYVESGYTLASDNDLILLPSLPLTSQQIYYNPEIANLLFFKTNKQYDYYWSIEYDVWMNGHWSTFFSICNKSQADLLCTYKQLYPGQPFFDKFWETYNFDVEDIHKRGMFGAINRMSYDLLEMLDKEYLSGKHGFYEAIVPTLAHINQMNITDINEIAGHYNLEFYHPWTYGGNSSENWKYMYKSRSWENYLFHPVRDLFYKEQL
jgi:hypothetical protein